MPNAISISGFTEFAGKLHKLPQVLQDRSGETVKFAAATWEQGAEQAAPVDQGRLKGEIKVVRNSALSYSIVVNSEQAPWIEWGTKSKVRVPGELAAYASQFKGRGSTLKGKGTAKEMIFAWCKRKGIPPEAWYPIYRSIMANGINPQPFFFIQRPRVEKQFLQDLRQVLNKLD